MRLRLAGFALLFTLGASAQVVRVTVSPDGAGDFKTIQRAVDHALDKVTKGTYSRVVIDIRPGTYRERVIVAQDKPRFTLHGLGERPDDVVISAAMSAKTAGGTFFSATLDVNGAEFVAENLTVENTYGTGSQAVAVSAHSDRAVFRRCRFLGMQDTVYAASGRQHYVDCYIAGHVDFIFGNSRTVFERCEIHSRGAGYIAAVSRTLADGETGFVFDHCKLTADEGVANVYLARPWRAYARVVYLDCWMGAHIAAEGWDNWGDAANERTAYFAEAGSTGPGATMPARAAWARTLTDEQIARFRAGAWVPADSKE